MKQFVLFSFLISTFCSLSQDLSTKIAPDANLMLQINGGKILEMVSESELEESFLFEVIVDEVFRNEDKISKLSDLGIDYSQPMYIVNELSPDVSLFYFSYHIKNLGVFEHLVKEEKGSSPFITENGINQIKYDEDSRLFWNTDYAIFISGDYIGYEFNNYYGDYGWGYEKKEEAVATEQPTQVEAVPDEAMTEEEYQEYLREQEEIRRKREDERRRKEEEREQKRKEMREKRNEIISNAIDSKISSYFSQQNTGDYLNFEYEDDAVAQFWYSNNILKYSEYSRRYGYRRPTIPMFGLGYFFGFSNAFNGSFTSRLFLDEEAVRLENSVNYPENLAQAYQAILSQKIDGQILKLIGDDDLGYISLSSSTEELLNHYPDILQETYSLFDSTNQEEYEYYADLFNIIIDEDRISEVITGDVVFVMNDLSEKEVEYYTYEYDENYNSTRVLKTRKELIPDFSIFVGCEDETLVKKSINIGLKREWLTKKGNGYQFIDEHNEFPFELFFSFNNDILVTTTSFDRMESYYDGKLENKVSSDKKKIVKSNSGGMYLNLNQLFSKMLLSEIRGEERRMLTSIHDDVSEIFAEMNYKNGIAKINAHTAVPDSHENGAQYLLSIINDLVKAESEH